MRKGIYCFVFLFILFSSLFVSAANDLDALQEGVESLEDKKEQLETLTDEDIRTDYLKTEWGKILAKKPIIGPMSAFYEKQKIAVLVDPIIKLLTGMETSVTWVFFLGLLLWATLLIVVYRSIRYAGDYPSIATFLVSVVFMGVLGFLGIIERASQFFIDLATTFTYWWVQLILGIVFVVGLIIVIYFSKYIQAFMLAMKLKKEKEEGEDTKKSLVDTIKDANKILKAKNKVDKI